MTDAKLVVCIEDEPEMIDLVKLILSRKGFQVVGAMGGREGLEAIQAQKPDLVLLDLMMPDMDGFAVCRALKENPQTAAIPIIMITARDDLDARAEGMRLGVCDFLAKPVFRRQLANRIRAQLDMAATGRLTEATLGQLAQIGNGEKK